MQKMTIKNSRIHQQKQQRLRSHLKSWCSDLRSKLWLFSLVLTSACVSNPDSTDTRPGEAEQNENSARLAAQTVLPATFTQASPRQVDWALIPKELLNIACVRNQAAALREGPGVKFQLKDKLIGQNSCVMVTHSTQVWSHVIDLVNQERGWIHSQALETTPGPDLLQGIPQTLKIKTENLPTVFTRNIIKYAYDHPKRQAKSVQIPRGIPFPLLLAGKEYALLWIQESNSVMWLKLDQLDAGN